MATSSHKSLQETIPLFDRKSIEDHIQRGVLESKKFLNASQLPNGQRGP